MGAGRSIAGAGARTSSEMTGSKNSTFLTSLTGLNSLTEVTSLVAFFTWLREQRGHTVVFGRIFMPHEQVGKARESVNL